MFLHVLPRNTRLTQILDVLHSYQLHGIVLELKYSLKNPLFHLIVRTVIDFPL